MITRELIEQREHHILSPFAAKADESLGRRMQEEPCDVRTVYQRDRDRIIHSKSFRRLMHKTQVFLAPEGDHFRTRLTHTIEVSQIARTIARGCGLNEDLVEAIAMGHDLGHTPFGHSGEAILNQVYSRGFRHNEQSLRVVDVLESGGSDRRGLNLTEEVRDGILHHTGSTDPFTMEGQVVKTSDRIAYINHDIDDAIRSGVITVEDLPAESLTVLGRTHKQRIDALVRDMIETTCCGMEEAERNAKAASEDPEKAGGSDKPADVLVRPMARLSDEKYRVMNELRAFMFRNVYHSSLVKRAEDMAKSNTVVESLFEFYMDHPDQLPGELRRMEADYDTEELVKDYVAGMTDRYALNLYDELFMVKGWR